MAYATRDDVYLLGLSALAFVVRPRPFEAVDTATGNIRLTAHGFTASDLVILSVTGGGSLPTGTSALTTYTPIVVSGDLFRLTGFTSYASGGAGWLVGYDTGRRLDLHLEAASAEINEDLTAHQPPVLVDPETGLYPMQLRGLCARMAARAAVTSMQIENPAYRVAVDRLFAREERDDAMRAEWRAGKPLHPRPVDSDELANNGARADYSRAPVPWLTGYL